MKTQKKAGRPVFKVTRRQRDLVALLIAAGQSEAAIAAVIGVSRQTLRQRFKAELATGHAVKTAEVLTALAAAGRRGNVSALKALAARFDATPEKPKKPRALGKKEQANAEAEFAHRDTSWATLIDFPAAKRRT